MTQPLLQPQPFESEWLGITSAQLTLRDGSSVPTVREQVAQALGEGRRNGVTFVSCRIEPTEWAAAAALEDAGFQKVETLITFERDIGSVPEPASETWFLAEGCIEDADECATIAQCAFSSDRFHTDSRIPNDRADNLKAAWVRNAFTGRGDTNLLIRDSRNAVLGFVLCMLRDETAVIDLIAISPHAQGKGMGKALVAGALKRYEFRAKRMRVGTQSTNAKSVALYTGMAFSPVSRRDTYHWMSCE